MLSSQPSVPFESLSPVATFWLGAVAGFVLAVCALTVFLLSLRRRKWVHVTELKDGTYRLLGDNMDFPPGFRYYAVARCEDDFRAEFGSRDDPILVKSYGTLDDCFLIDSAKRVTPVSSGCRKEEA